MVRAPRPVGPDHKSWRGQKALSTVDLGNIEDVVPRTFGVSEHLLQARD